MAALISIFATATRPILIDWGSDGPLFEDIQVAKKIFQLLPEPASIGDSSTRLQIDLPSDTIAILDEAKRLSGLSRKALITHLFRNVLTPMLQEEIERRKTTQPIAQSTTRPSSEATDLETPHSEQATQKDLFYGEGITSEQQQ